MITKPLGIKGLITDNEGEALAELASYVAPELAIIELGSHRGLSSCWIAYGSTGAHVTCVDPWPLYDPLAPKPLNNDIDWAEEGALEQWKVNVAACDLSARLTPLRSTAIEVARTWAKPVGMWFHDASHRYEDVRDDFLAWKPYLVHGAWIAVHDFYEGWPDGNGGWRRTKVEQAAVAEHILPSGRFTDIMVVDGLWVGRRWLE